MLGLSKKPHPKVLDEPFATQLINKSKTMKPKHVALLLAISASVVSCSINNDDRKREIDPRTERTVQSVAGFELGKDGFGEVMDKLKKRFDCPDSLSPFRFDPYYIVDGLYFLGRQFDKTYFWFSDTRRGAPLFMVEFEMHNARRTDFELLARILNEQYDLYTPAFHIEKPSSYEEYRDDHKNKISFSMNNDVLLIRYINNSLYEEWIEHQGKFYQNEMGATSNVLDPIGEPADSRKDPDLLKPRDNKDTASHNDAPSRQEYDDDDPMQYYDFSKW